MVRGNERKSLFLDDEDRNRFLNTLFIKSIDQKSVVHAYCLMANHVHLLINEGSDSIGKIMKRINVSYAYYFNKKYERIGHLFQDRFRSEVIDTDTYLLAATRYIHNNPVKAGLVTKPGMYAWSSYNSYMGHVKPAGRIDTEFILKMFSKDTIKAKQLFMEYTGNHADKDMEDSFIEYKEGDTEDTSIHTHKEAEEFIGWYNNGTSDTVEGSVFKGNKKYRNALIRELKAKSNLSIREIAKILNLDRNIIQRVK